MIKNNENFDLNIMKSNIGSNIFSRIKAIYPDHTRFEAVILYNSPTRAQVAISWTMIEALSRVPISSLRNFEVIINFLRIYMYNLINNTSIRNRRVGNQPRDLEEFWRLLHFTMIMGFGGNTVDEIQSRHPNPMGVYISIDLNNTDNLMTFNPRWEVWTGQFDIDHC